MNDLQHWLALWHIPGIGPGRFAKLLQRFPDLKHLFEASELELQSLGLKEEVVAAIRNPDWRAVERDLRWAERSGCYIVTVLDEIYPNLLKEIPGAPPVLFVQGQVEVLSLPQIAMVGSRHPSKAGVEVARDFASHLVEAGLAITSGLALGIDSASHRGALEARGKTVAVLGNGLNEIYPAANKKLAQQIIQSGALVSEFPLDLEPLKTNFPRRNRIVSGLSLGTLVVEATLRSGSLITAYLANEQNREVFAIPGSIHHHLARGCHLLIRRGAKLVETVQDILEEIPISSRSLCCHPKAPGCHPKPLRCHLEALGCHPKPLCCHPERSRGICLEVRSLDYARDDSAELRDDNRCQDDAMPRYSSSSYATNSLHSG
jgi:DNA processing protein